MFFSLFFVIDSSGNTFYRKKPANYTGSIIKAALKTNNTKKVVNITRKRKEKKPGCIISFLHPYWGPYLSKMLFASLTQLHRLLKTENCLL